VSVEQRLLELADETLRDARWKTEIRKIAEELRMIEARIKRLEEAGDAMATWLSDPRNLGDDPFMSSQWQKAKEAKP